MLSQRKNDVLGYYREEFCSVTSKLLKDELNPSLPKDWTNDLTLDLICDWLLEHKLILTHSVLRMETSPPDLSRFREPEASSETDSAEFSVGKLTFRAVCSMESAGILTETKAKLLAYKYLQLIRNSVQAQRKVDDHEMRVLLPLVRNWLLRNSLVQSPAVLVKEIQLEFGVVVAGDSHGDLADRIEQYKKLQGGDPRRLKDILVVEDSQ